MKMAMACLIFFVDTSIGQQKYPASRTADESMDARYGKVKKRARMHTYAYLDAAEAWVAG